MKMYRHAGAILTGIPLLRFRPRQRIKHLKLPFLHPRVDRTISMRRGPSASPPRFRSKSEPRAGPDLSSANAFRYDRAASLCSLSLRQLKTALMCSNCAECFSRPFLRRQFHRLAIGRFALPPDGRQLTGLEIGMILQKPQRVTTRNGACWPVSPERTIRPPPARSKSRFMSSMPTAPASSNTINCRSVRAGLSTTGFAGSWPRIPPHAELPWPMRWAHRRAARSRPPCRRRPARAAPWFCPCPPDRAGR